MINENIRKNIMPQNGTKYIFFSGKGGVGKSTMSCSTSVWLSNQGYKTLLVTTDPAPNLSDVFKTEIGHKITKIKENLDAIEIDPDKASEEYRNRTIEPMKVLLDEKGIETMKEQLNSPCIEEIAAFDKFIEFMDNPEYDVVVFDTAPTGHTIRLLELPSGWSSTLKEDAATCIGPSASLQEQKKKYEQAVKYLQDDEKTTFIFVMKPENSSISETKRSTLELSKLGINSKLHIVNGVLPKDACEDDFFIKKYEKEQETILTIKENFGENTIINPLSDSEISGIDSLERVGKQVYDNVEMDNDDSPTKNTDIIESFEVENVAEKSTTTLKDKKYIFFTGKGGVGKSTFASTTALRLADEGFKTLIVTTDPASHLQEIFEKDVNHEPSEITKNLFAARIDQKNALDEYRERILKSVADMDENTRKSVEEDLNSPCAEEMAAFEKFMSYFELEGYDKIIFDTAPTGHTLRLLELPSDWKGFADLGTMTKETGVTEKYTKIINTMKDKEITAFVFVMFPEYTPIIEAWRSSEDLKKQVGIETSMVAVNYIMPREFGKNNFFENRKKQEQKYISMIKEKFLTPMIVAPMLMDEPTGINNIRNLGIKIYGD